MDMVFNINPGHRPESEWRRMLSELIESLSAFTSIQFVPTSWFIEDIPGYANSAGCVDVVGIANAALRLDVCGVVCISVNHGEASWASADLLLYSSGQRVYGPGGTEIVSFLYQPEGWIGRGWMRGEGGEWEGDTDARWKAADLLHPSQAGPPHV